MRTLAANLCLRGRKALLIGAGSVGSRKLAYLLGSGAAITVVEPYPEPWLDDLRDAGRIGLVPVFSEGLLEGDPLIFLATEPAPYQGLIREALGRGLWVNVAGSPELGNMTLPALAEDGPFRLAVSTGGASPALARRVAERLREGYRGYGDLCKVLMALRPHVLGSDLGPDGRRAVLARLAGSNALAASLGEGRLEDALGLIGQLLEPLGTPPGFSLAFLKE
ncbi:MAG: bifunctional precorrin-2 dehydrogenase/sirohydrochlorin ferrochelatase [Deltaproteobacteria bacterium]|jgi:precorrin-2 dehydrogenase/sirohydrochlorin ferrochelatase|nr:bifunctional precorrin-2 dehydrogenase/sirohydrochlorin ferrochelatase [Deltaproteobacteria bacterium]